MICSAQASPTPRYRWKRRPHCGPWLWSAAPRRQYRWKRRPHSGPWLWSAAPRRRPRLSTGERHTLTRDRDYDVWLWSDTLCSSFFLGIWLSISCYSFFKVIFYPVQHCRFSCLFIVLNLSICCWCQHLKYFSDTKIFRWCYCVTMRRLRLCFYECGVGLGQVLWEVLRPMYPSSHASRPDSAISERRWPCCALHRPTLYPPTGSIDTSAVPCTGQPCTYPQVA